MYIYIHIYILISLGDKDHHQPVLHFSMPLHVCLIITFLLFPIVIDDIYSRFNKKSEQNYSGIGEII
jgi:hypothetical protein